MTNRMLESLNLFSSVVNNIHFQSVGFIVFFNKVDLFREKLKKKSIRIAFPDFLPPNTASGILKGCYTQCYINQNMMECNTFSVNFVFASVVF